jgi:hypothetical protein
VVSVEGFVVMCIATVRRNCALLLCGRRAVNTAKQAGHLARWPCVLHRWLLCSLVSAHALCAQSS